jgi:membrane protease YdiL (CAAX protease family)
MTMELRLAGAPLTRPHRGWRLLELAVVGLGLPLALWYWQLHGGGVPVIPSLLLGSLWVVWRLKANNRGLYAGIWRKPQAQAWREMLLRALIVLPSLAVLARVMSPETWLRLPREQPGLWAAILVFYPLFSVLPQELIFRVGFTWRYRGAFPREPEFLVVSAACFGLVHLFFGSWVSVVLSGFGGVLFAVGYLRTRSIWLPAAEHALYGGWIFTVGLGPFFYNGGAA